jgi:hypothetical protein
MDRKIRAGVFTNEVTIRIDESVSGTTYIGKAPLGSSESLPVWQVMKIVESAGLTDITWADGNSVFDNVWDARTSLTYG